MKSDLPKNMIAPWIIEVLKEYSDSENTMTQAEIGKKLEADYGLSVNRKTLSINLRLVYNQYSDRIHCDISRRNGEKLSEEDDDEGAIYTNFWYEPVFEKSELQALIYNVIFSKHLAVKHKNELIEKLEGLGNKSIRHDTRHYISIDKESSKESSQEFGDLFFKLDELEVAIKAKEIVEFQYAYYNIDKKFVAYDRVWKVFPLEIAEKDNDFYLVGLVCGSENESPEDLIRDVKKLIDNIKFESRYVDTFRIDRIQNLRLTENDELSEEEKKLARKMELSIINKEWSTIQEYVSQNSSLFPGRSIRAKFKMIGGGEGSISDAIDYFGKKNIVRIEPFQDQRTEAPKPDGFLKDSRDYAHKHYLFTVKTNDQAMMEFAKTHAHLVEVIEPIELRDELCEIFKAAYERLMG